LLDTTCYLPAIDVSIKEREKDALLTLPDVEKPSKAEAC
jgi:hypothetical protein